MTFCEKCKKEINIEDFSVEICKDCYDSLQKLEKTENEKTIIYRDIDDIMIYIMDIASKRDYKAVSAVRTLDNVRKAFLGDFFPRESKSQLKIRFK